MCEICSELTTKTTEWRHSRRSSVFLVNFEQIAESEQVNTSPGGGGIWKIKKTAWKYGAGESTFPIQFFQVLSFLHLEITLPFPKLCYAFEE